VRCNDGTQAARRSEVKQLLAAPLGVEQQPGRVDVPAPEPAEAPVPPASPPSIRRRAEAPTVKSPGTPTRRFAQPSPSRGVRPPSPLSPTRSPSVVVLKQTPARDGEPHRAASPLGSPVKEASTPAGHRSPVKEASTPAGHRSPASAWTPASILSEDTPPRPVIRTRPVDDPAVAAAEEEELRRLAVGGSHRPRIARAPAPASKAGRASNPAQLLREVKSKLASLSGELKSKTKEAALARSQVEAAKEAMASMRQ
jgi:hypothetical protein